MYRMNRRTPLSTGHCYGDIIYDGDLKPEVIEKFLKSRTLIRISTPPLSELPGTEWEKRAKELKKASILQVGEFVEADAEAIAEYTTVKARTIKRWQKEAVEYLKPNQVKKNK